MCGKMENEGMEKQTINLSSLIGLHKLTGVDLGSFSLEKYGYVEDVNSISFKLDSKVYTAIEDLNDGYRSSMEEIYIDNRKVKNTFPACKVLGRMRIGDYESHDLIEFIDVETKKIVLAVGTENCNDYYPCFINYFHPENMSINKDK